MAQPRRLAPGETLVLAGLLAGLVILLLTQDWLWRWDQVLYDAQLPLLGQPAGDDIVIVAIDEQSLATYGRWPWPRATHARMLDRLSADGPRAVALDIIFAEPDMARPDGDRQLAEAIDRHGKVVLPVLMEQRRHGGIPVETLPYPLFAEQAAGMGHVHVELDEDGIARRFFLYEGLGGSYWPHITMVLMQVAGIAVPIYPDIEEGVRSPGVWYRERELLIPYAGPPGHFARISYDQVVRGDFVPGTFRDKLVLVGVTAAGLGDALPTPVSGYSHSMPGIEINANILQALLTGGRISVLDRPLVIAITILIALLPVFIYPHLEPRNNLLLAACLLLSVLLLSAGLLVFGRIWFPTAVALVAVTLGYPLWSWRRLERTMRFLNQELDELQRQRAALAIHQELDIPAALSFLERLLPIEGWLLQDENGAEIERHGNVTAVATQPATTARWLAGRRAWLAPVEHAGRRGTLLVNWSGKRVPDRASQSLLDQLAARARPAGSRSDTSSDLLQARITQVRDATSQLSSLRRFVEDALSFMSDGVIVADPFGKILIANQRAAWYLAGDEGASLSGRLLPDWLQDVQLQDGMNWNSLLYRVLLEDEHVEASARQLNGRDLLVQLAPLRVHDAGTDAVVINLSDISRLRSSERRRSELLNFLSHDLRSPLVSMLALLELANARRTDAELDELLQRMQGNAERTLSLAEQFLQLARAEGGERHEYGDVDLVSVAWNAHEQVWAQARAKEIRLVNDLAIETAWISGEGELLERALINLLTNAIKYSAAGTTVTVSLSLQDEEYRCCVADEGPGIPAESVPVLFDRFRRVNDTGEADTSGAGLGLAIVDAVIRRHGGTVSVSSEPGQGSVFCFTLPAAAGNP